MITAHPHWSAAWAEFITIDSTGAIQWDFAPTDDQQEFMSLACRDWAGCGLWYGTGDDSPPLGAPLPIGEFGNVLARYVPGRGREELRSYVGGIEWWTTNGGLNAVFVRGEG